MMNPEHRRDDLLDSTEAILRTMGPEAAPALEHTEIGRLDDAELAIMALTWTPDKSKALNFLQEAMETRVPRDEKW